MKILMRNEQNEDWELVDIAGYAAEAELQRLLAESPSLISLEEVLEGAPSLVAAVREMGLPGSGNTDIIAFNGQGDIVIVECKLAANQEIRRKVIAHVLEYGAYLWQMSYEDLNAQVFKRTEKNLADLVGEALGDSDWDEEEFRVNIEGNLSNGSFVLVIAVDEMNDELLRTMRFLNACGNPAFSFTVLEMRRFQKNETEILVPHLHGVFSQTKAAQPRRGQWTEREYFELMENKYPEELVEIYYEIFHWAQKTADRIFFGTGKEKGSFTFHYLLDGRTISVFSVYTDGYITLNYGWLIRQLDEEYLDYFHNELIKISTFANISANYNGWHSIKVKEAFLNNSDHLDNFMQLVENFGKKIQE